MSKQLFALSILRLKALMDTCKENLKTWERTLCFHLEGRNNPSKGDIKTSSPPKRPRQENEEVFPEETCETFTVYNDG